MTLCTDAMQVKNMNGKARPMRVRSVLVRGFSVYPLKMNSFLNVMGHYGPLVMGDDWWTFNQSDCFKMMSHIKTTNQIALKFHHPLCLHKNSPLADRGLQRLSEWNYTFRMSKSFSSTQYHAHTRHPIIVAVIKFYGSLSKLIQFSMWKLS